MKFSRALATDNFDKYLSVPLRSLDFVYKLEVTLVNSSGLGPFTKTEFFLRGPWRPLELCGWAFSSTLDRRDSQDRRCYDP
jgi:hypothetical protein